jgi:NADPH:quinone reductase-like Zn-dependent oxidoreductase
MKAIVYEKYGSPDVLALKEVEKPTMKDDLVLVNVVAAAVNFADWALLTGNPFLVRLASGLLKPKNKILGSDIAGQVAAVGKNAKAFQPGDEVFGDISACGLGGLAEFVAVPETALVLKPANVSFVEAAAVPMAAVTALQGIRFGGQIQPGQKVLIHGASGGVGTFALQIAKSFGAEVTAVCSTSKMEMVRSIGADHVIDYTKEDFTQNGQQYDFIIGANGYRTLSDYKRALRPDGVYVCIGGTMPQIFQSMLLGPLMSLNSGKKLTNMGSAKPNQKDLAFIKTLLEAGKVVPVMDRNYPLAEAAEALRYIGGGHAKGKVVIKVWA